MFGRRPFLPEFPAKPGRQPRLAVLVAGLDEGLELGDGDVVARDLERIDALRDLLDYLRVGIARIGADLDGHLCRLLDRVPGDVR